VSRYVKFKENLESRRYQESSVMIEGEVLKDMEDDKYLATQTSGGEEDLVPSSPVRIPMWLLQRLRDVGEGPRIMFRESGPLRKFPNYMELMSSMIDAKPSSFEEATYQ
jgi:hypothetical protein